MNWEGMMSRFNVVRGMGLAGLVLLWGAYPLCVALGLDACVGWLSNGYLPTAAELLGAGIVLAARVAQCMVAPMLLLAWLGWALAQGVLARALPSGA